MWDPDEPHEPLALSGPTDMVLSFAVLADRRLAVGSYDGTVHVWEVPPANSARHETDS